MFKKIICLGLAMIMVFFAIVSILTYNLTRKYGEYIERYIESYKCSIKYALSKTEQMDYDSVNKTYYINNAIYGIAPIYTVYYSSLFLDNNLKIISRSGLFLKIMPKNSSKNDILMISLEQFCTDEQIEQMCTVLLEEQKKETLVTQENIVYLQVDITGYFNKWDFIPQKISFSLQGVTSAKKILTLEFNNIPGEGEESETWEREDATLWIGGFYKSYKWHQYTSEEKAIIKECEAMAYNELNYILENDLVEKSGENKYEYWYVSRTVINGEECYLLMVAKGYPLQNAISQLIPTYIILFLLTIILFFIILGIIIKIHKRKMELDFKKNSNDEFKHYIE